MDDEDRAEGPDHPPSGKLGGDPVEPHELAPKEVMPDPPEGGNRQPREEDAVDRGPGQHL